VQQLLKRNIIMVISIMRTRTRANTVRQYAERGIAHHHFDAVDCEAQDLSFIAPAVHAL
jgi:hypothetical protein